MAAANSSDLLSPPVAANGWLRGVSSLTVISTFFLVILGGVVRVTGSGLGCPDWPLCHGRFLPPLEITAIIEYTHRLVASAIVSPLVLLTCGLVWISHRRERWLVVPATLALVLLLAQGGLGGITVVRELPGSIVAAHLALGQALLACLALVMVVAYRGGLSRRKDARSVPDRFPRLAVLSALAVYLLLLTGAYVTATGALAACRDWPLCNGLSLPGNHLSMIHMLHRLVAAIVGGLALYTLHLGFRDRQRPREVRLIALTAAGLFLAQVLVGAISIWLKFPVELRALHLALATAVWLALAALAMLSFSSNQAANPDAGGPPPQNQGVGEGASA